MSHVEVHAEESVRVRGKIFRSWRFRTMVNQAAVGSTENIHFPFSHFHHARRFSDSVTGEESVKICIGCVTFPP